MIPRIKILTHIPSPYQVELFDAIAANGQLDIEVGYLYSTNPMRPWAKQQPRHPHVFLNDDADLYDELGTSLTDFDLVVFHYYRNAHVIELLKRRSASGKAWCFWGERPGYHRLGILGLLYRKWNLSELNQKPVPIWGMGKWAVDQYRKDYGNGRLYCNVPYYSDLERFKRTQQDNHAANSHIVFLYSGSLIPRKGVDLLAKAFRRLATEFPNVRLRILGDGPLRSHLEKRLSRFVDRVQFAGFQEWQELPGFYRSSDILCVPSRYDGWNLVVPEGLAAGLPVIGTNKTGAALELINPTKNGWLIPADDANALYQSMREAALLSREALDERGAAAERSVLKHSIHNGVHRFQEAVASSIRAFG